MSDMQIHNKTLSELRKGLIDKEYSSSEITKAFLARIKDHDESLNAFITVTADKAIEESVLADQLIAKGKHKLLTGLPIAHKDLFCTNGILTSCGSKMLHNFIPPYDATVVKRLSESGAVMLGKTNMDEFAMGSSNETSHYGPVNNPWDLSLSPGGSSGGSAAAVRRAARNTARGPQQEAGRGPRFRQAVKIPPARGSGL